MFASLKEALTGIVDMPGIAIITGLLTLNAQIGDDLKVALTQKSMDSFFDTFTLVVLVVFSMEIGINSIAKEKYLFDFFCKKLRKPSKPLNLRKTKKGSYTREP